MSVIFRNVTRCAIVAVVLGVAGCGGSAERRGPEVIAPEAQRVANLPFSPAVRAGDFIFLSGAVGNRPGTTELVSPDVGAQTRQTMENLRAVLQSAGSGLEDVVKCTVFLVDMRDYPAMNAVYASFWDAAPPARSTVAGSGLALGARVEIECIAYDPR